MENINFEQTNENSKKGKTATYILGGLVYIGVIIVSVVLTSMFITSILPGDAYGLRLLVTLGVCAVGLNAVALPVGLHFWAVDGAHRGLAITFYGADMLILAVNLVTSFSTLSGNPPAWVESYAPYSVGMLVFALASWGVLKMVDPGETAALELLKAQRQFRVKAIRQATAYLDSTEGRAAIAAGAAHLIPAMFDPDRLRDVPRSWNNGEAQDAEAVPESVPFGSNGRPKSH